MIIKRLFNLLLKALMILGTAFAVVFYVIGILCRSVAAPTCPYGGYDRHGRY